ncbi:PREDICTED: cyclin-J-like [Priapulus caudatus]|uniref:Cyclin-J-like n=1 Tax=Priapulus caudatus TaxID=37621 RepID=A0ABM1EUP0_PRICU|nr:PREDICTED: cyclin-J-like [Priapulus caudatus]
MYYELQLAELLSSVSGKHQTVHLAIYLLDNFMDQYDIQDKTIYLVTLTCLLIAIKVEEDNQVPKISELNSCINNGFHLREFLQMELMLLKAFAFDLTIPTAAHFVCYYETRAVTLADLRRYTDDNGITVDDDTFTLLLEKARVNMRRHIDYFLETSLQSMRIVVNGVVCVVAAACVVPLRHCIRSLLPRWPPPCRLIRVAVRGMAQSRTLRATHASSK